MMTLVFLSFAVNCWFLLRRRSRWGWILVLATLALGTLVFYLDLGDGAMGVQL